jgi:hypothetical protein
MLLDAKKRKAEADQAIEDAKNAPPAPAPVSSTIGFGGINWKGKAEERRLKEMEKNKEFEFPSLVAEK